jgi:small-conductance mechanosensitive channel
MLSRLILLALQAIAAWFAADHVLRYLPRVGVSDLYLRAVVFAVIVWLVGLVMSQVLRETAMPSSATLVAALVVALVAAAIYLWLPTLVPDAKRFMANLQANAYPLIGALIGYHIRR